MTKGKLAISGAAAGAENAARVRTYLENLEAVGRGLPERDGKPNMSAIALAAGVDRQVLYKNPAARVAVEEAATRLGLEAFEPRATQPVRDLRDQRILKLEQENASLKAENSELRRRLRQLEHMESHMAETGRRVVR
jgi:Family of unknown function (DUF6262)